MPLILKLGLCEPIPIETLLLVVVQVYSVINIEMPVKYRREFRENVLKISTNHLVSEL